MDKLLKNKWFARIISFIIALMLYAVVSVGDEPGQLDLIPNNNNNNDGGGDESRNLEDVPLSTVYNDEKYILSGLPEQVSVRLRGPDSSITKTMLANDFEVFVNLKGMGPGTHKVPIHKRGFPEELDVNIVPEEITVKLHEKVTETFPVQIDLVNEDDIAEGHKIGDPIAMPNQVKVTGAKKVVEQIASVEGRVDVENAEDTLGESVPLNIYDQEGNELKNLQFTPSVVEVKVPITGPSKSVPLKFSRKASLPDGLSIQSIKLEPAEVTLFAPQEVLDEIEFIDDIPLPLNDIKEDTNLDIDVPVPEGVNKINPKTIKVTVDVAEQVTKDIEDVPIEVIGLSDALNLNFEKPADALIDVTLKGTERVLDSIEKKDIEAHVDVSDLSTGEHSVEIQINGPQNIKPETEIAEAEIIITNGNATNVS